METKQIEAKKEKSSDVPVSCVGCIRWEKHGKSCWYYWEGKKHCTMLTSDIEELSKTDMAI
jgi:hypothetical protein|tara:strand:+ start:1687 stop:1869 length:183 start_codon:yes stop_codon:yes gene_type:complete